MFCDGASRNFYNHSIQCDYFSEYAKEKEEPITEPAKLFRVQRIKTAKGRPHWEKRVLIKLGVAKSVSSFHFQNDIWTSFIFCINLQLGDVAIIKNIPEMNMLLYRVKHLIKVDPITFPYGEPTQDDINNTYLTPNGECIVTKDISIDPKRIEATDEFINDPKRLDKVTLNLDSLQKWVNPRR